MIHGEVNSDDAGKGAAFRGARDSLKASENGPNDKKQQGGTRRPALGDVTNRQLHHHDAKHAPVSTGVAANEFY